MLIDFSVENFRSIKEKVKLSMVASGSKYLEENIFSVKAPRNIRLLKSAVIYGANASGKSNIIRALNFMRDLVLNSHKMQMKESITIQPFMLDKRYENKESSFEISFIKNKIIYVYGFSLNKNRIIEEHLYSYPKGRKSIIFERNEDTFRFTKEEKFQKNISEMTLPNALYLSTSTKMNYERTKPVFEWFNDIHIITPNDAESMISHIKFFDLLGFSNLAYLETVKLMKENKIKQAILKIIRKADISVDDISIKNEIFEEKPREPKEAIKLISNFEIKFIHKRNLKNGKTEKVEFDLADESDGTKKLFRILAPWVDALMNGKLIVVDELDIRLHPLLTDMLVKMFHNKKQNKKNAQLIFTTHNTYLMKRDFFRKDQIWLTEKKEDQSTDLYSLYDVKGVRKNENIEKGYLLGRYGGIPFIDLGDIEL